MPIDAMVWLGLIWLILGFCVAVEVLVRGPRTETKKTGLAGRGVAQVLCGPCSKRLHDCQGGVCTCGCRMIRRQVTGLGYRP